jgi:hypothetical protein
MDMRKLMQKSAASGVALLLLVFAPAALAAADLAVPGAQLQPVILADVVAGIVEKQVGIADDVIEATYVVVQMPGSQALMRNRQGVFLPWDLDPAGLADNGFVAENGRLLFKVLDQDISAQNFPVRVTIYYRANGELKFGYFDVMRAN